MVNNIFSKLLQYKYQIDVCGRLDSKKFIQWNTYYTSYSSSSNIKCGEDTCSTFANITIHVPFSPINIKSYSFLTIKDGIFPTEWSIYGSYDGLNWTELDRVNESLCTVSYVYSIENPMLYCNISQVRTYQITNHDFEYYHYFRYNILKNSYALKDEWSYAITTNDFDVNGDFLIPFPIFTVKSNYFINHKCISIFIYLIYCL